MTRLHHTTRRLALVLALVAVSLLATEAALALVDPLGIWRYYNDLRAVRARLWPHETRVYVAEPGRFSLSNWSYQIDLPDYTRHTPASVEDADCSIVALGDSVTFGLGVNDAEAWPNLLAQRTGCRVLNAALPGYDLWAVYAAYKAFPGADRYIYLLINNDATHDAPDQLLAMPGITAIRAYVYLLQNGGADVPGAVIPVDFWQVYDALVSDARVTVFGFRDGGLAEQVAASGRRIALLAPYTSRLSWVDAHPDAAGQREIMERMVRDGQDSETHCDGRDRRGGASCNVPTA